MNYVLSLAGRKINDFILKFYLYPTEEKWLLLNYYLSTCLSCSFVLTGCRAITWVTKNLVQAITNVHAGCRFPIPVVAHSQLTLLSDLAVPILKGGHKSRHKSRKRRASPRLLSVIKAEHLLVLTCVPCVQYVSIPNLPYNKRLQNQWRTSTQPSTRLHSPSAGRLWHQICHIAGEVWPLRSAKSRQRP